MTTRTTPRLDRRLDSRQLPDFPYPPRGAGLYSEVVWDRSRATAAAGKRLAAPSSGHPASSDE
jgi:hypothetical protein